MWSADGSFTFVEVQMANKAQLNICHWLDTQVKAFAYGTAVAVIGEA